MKIHIDLELTPRAKRIGMLVLAGSVLLFGGAAAYAQTTPGSSSDTLIGSALNTLGNAVATLQAQVAALQAADRTGRATISASGTVLAQNGRWVSRVDHPSQQGTYTLMFASGVFSSAPTCVATAASTTFIDPATIAGPSLTGPFMVCGPASATSVTCQMQVPKGPTYDAGFSILCSGPP